jgi:hypothetical protein
LPHSFHAPAQASGSIDCFVVESFLAAAQDSALIDWFTYCRTALMHQHKLQVRLIVLLAKAFLQ